MIIALEGIDNAGKTSVAQILEKKFIEKGKVTVVSKELTTSVGGLIKSSIKGEGLSPISKAFLFAADRQIRIESLYSHDSFEHVVIFDRYLYSAIAYREAEGLEGSWVKDLNKYVPPSDFNFYIDITAEESIRRNTDKKFNIHYDVEYLKRVRESYLRYVNCGELIKIDGMAGINGAAVSIFEILTAKGVIVWKHPDKIN